MSFNLPQRIRTKNAWWSIREDHEPVLCKQCGTYGHPKDMVFCLLTDRTTGTYHRGCAPVDVTVLA